MRKLKLTALFLILLPVIAHAELKNGMDADIVLGQPDFTTSSAGTTAFKMSQPTGVWSDGKRLFVVDELNNRVLIYNSIPTANNTPADLVLGQPNMNSSAANNGGVSAKTLNTPQAINTDGIRLFVADTGNNRVLIWNSIPTTNFAPADIVVGQPDFVTTSNATSNVKFDQPQGVFSDGKRLFISEWGNFRVVIYNSIPTRNGAAADIVIGEPDFNTVIGGTSRTLTSRVAGVMFDGQRLFLGDSRFNHRVLIFNSVPTKNAAAADVVLGQSDFNTSVPGTSQNRFRRPFYVYSDGIRLFISEQDNRRILVYKKIPTTNFAPADYVLGEPDFNTSSGGISRNRTAEVYGVFSDGKRLFACDIGNNRVLIFNIGSGSSAIEPGPQFEQGKAVLGKVFEDANGNGWQDSGERGLDGVKVVSDTGIYAITDEDGKYHFPYIETGQHILKIDESTLPDGAVVTTDNPYKVVVTEGVLTKVSFGVKLPASEVKETIADTSGPLLKVSMSQDASSLKPRLAVSAEQIRDKKDGKDKVVFTIDCNYYLFIKRAELKLYDSNEKEIKRIELPQPLPLKYEISLTELSGGTGLQSPDSRHLDHRGQVHYQLSVFDQKNKEDRTGIGSLALVEAKAGS